MKIVTVFLGVLLLVTLVIMPACKAKDARSQQLSSTEMSELSLAVIWQYAIDCTDIEDSTARLETFRLTADHNKEISSLDIIFHGTNIGGHPKVCFVSLAQGGKLAGHSYNAESVGYGRHPMEVFRELDKVGLENMAEMEMGDGGFSLEIGFCSGGFSYNSIYSDIYEELNGQLVPLKEISFNNQTLVAVIALYQIQLDSDSTVTFPQAEGTRTSQLWFLAEDLANAGSVEYLKALTQNYWGLAIGVGQYRYLDVDTQYADDDARELTEQLGILWGSDHVKLVVDSSATKESIGGIVREWLAPKANKEDVVLVFLASHGDCNRIRLYDSVEDTENKDLHYSDLLQFLDVLKSTNIVIITDICGSGSLKDILSNSHYIALTCGTDCESCWQEDQYGHGIFSYYLIQALKHLAIVDTNEDQSVSVEELFDYINRKIESEFEMYPPSSSQHPQMVNLHRGGLTLFQVPRGS